MVVTPVNDLTTYDSSTTFVGTGISIRTGKILPVYPYRTKYLHINVVVDIIIDGCYIVYRALGGRTPYICVHYIPRMPISIRAWICGRGVFDVKTDQTRSLPIEHVYTYIRDDRVTLSPPTRSKFPKCQNDYSPTICEKSSLKRSSPSTRIYTLEYSLHLSSLSSTSSLVSQEMFRIFTE